MVSGLWLWTGICSEWDQACSLCQDYCLQKSPLNDFQWLSASQSHCVSRSLSSLNCEQGNHEKAEESTYVVSIYWKFYLNTVCPGFFWPGWLIICTKITFMTHVLYIVGCGAAVTLVINHLDIKLSLFSVMKPQYQTKFPRAKDEGIWAEWPLWRPQKMYRSVQSASDQHWMCCRFSNFLSHVAPLPKSYLGK